MADESATEQSPNTEVKINCVDRRENELSKTDSIILTKDKNNTLLYGLKRKPSAILTGFLAVQTILVSLLNIIWLPLILSPFLCIHPDDPARIQIVSLSLFSSGLSTLFFSSFGIRLPILLIPSMEYIKGMMRILVSPDLKCPGAGDLYAMGHINRTQEWHNRFNYLQGGILMMSLFQLLLGLSGISCIFDKIISNPVVLISATIIVGYSYADQLTHLTITANVPTITDSTMSWGTVFLTIGLVIVVAFRFHKLEFITPSYSLSKGFGTSYIRLFKLFPVLVTGLVVLIIYPLLCKLVYGSVSDAKKPLNQALENSQLFYFHKPFPFGWPSFHPEAFMALLPAGLNQVFLSALIYRITNFIYGEKVKTRYVNRGILMEGVSSSIAGIFGMNSVSCPINIGFTQMTGVGHRWVLQLTGVLLILSSIYSKTIAILVAVSPLFILSCLCVISALISATGLTLLQKVNFKSVRNCIVIGISTYAGIVLPNLITSVSSESKVTAFVVELFSSSAIICIAFATVLDYLLPEKELPEQDTSETDLDRQKNYEFTACEEILATCL